VTREKPKTVAITNSIWAILDPNLAFHGEKQETTCLSYGMAFYTILST
jgi:hypothetical protein